MYKLYQEKEIFIRIRTKRWRHYIVSRLLATVLASFFWKHKQVIILALILSIMTDSQSEDTHPNCSSDDDRSSAAAKQKQHNSPLRKGLTKVTRCVEFENIQSEVFIWYCKWKKKKKKKEKINSVHCVFMWKLIMHSKCLQISNGWGLLLLLLVLYFI